MCRLITRSEAERLSEGALGALFRELSAELVRTEAGSPARRTCLASLETVERTLHARRAGR